MKKIAVLTLASLFLSGCIDFEAMEYRYKIDPNDKSGEMWVTYTNLGSDSEEESAIQEDLRDLIEDQWLGNDFILGAIEDGVAILERDLYVEDGKLIGKYYGIFKDIDTKLDEIMLLNDEYFFFIDLDFGNVVETNGELVSTKKNTFIIFPNDGGEMWWRQEPEMSENFSSLAERFMEEQKK